MVQKSRRAIRSREEREIDTSRVAVEQDAAVDDVGNGVDDLRRLAQEHGYSLSKEPKAKGVRPEAKNGRVRLTCNVAVEVRDVMEVAKYQIPMDFSEMVNKGVTMLLESMGFRVKTGR